MNINKLLFSLPILFLPLVASASTSLSVPYTSQAPFGDWSQPWQDACEETSILMVDHYYTGESLDSNIAKDELLEILTLKENKYGWSLDENASKVMSLINSYFSWSAYLINSPSLSQIKNEIDNGRPVILPYYGKSLKNQFFTRAGPTYHMNVISGYDDDAQEFISQETGMNNGRNFRYSYTTIMNAIHDYLPENTEKGNKVAIFTSENISDVILKEHSLLKSPNDPKVYYIRNSEKRHILNETIFIRHGWQWWQIKVVDEEVLKKIENSSTVSN